MDTCPNYLGPTKIGEVLIDDGPRRKCLHAHVLCVSCRKLTSDDNSQIMIRFQTNSIPPYCFNMLHKEGQNLDSPFALDFEVSWNERVSLEDSRITSDMVLSQDMTDEILCKNGEWTNAKYIPPKLRYFDYKVFL